MSKGLYVICHDWAPKKQDSGHDQSRAVCIMSPKPGCQTCGHSKFVIRFQVGIGNQDVACPRWIDEGARLDRKPAEYVTIRREVCLTARPFHQCVGCPNGDPSLPPTNTAGWYEERRRAREEAAEQEDES